MRGFAHLGHVWRAISRLVRWIGGLVRGRSGRQDPPDDADGSHPDLIYPLW